MPSMDDAYVVIAEPHSKSSRAAVRRLLDANYLSVTCNPHISSSQRDSEVHCEFRIDGRGEAGIQERPTKTDVAYQRGMMSGAYFMANYFCGNRKENAHGRAAPVESAAHHVHC